MNKQTLELIEKLTEYKSHSIFLNDKYSIIFHGEEIVTNEDSIVFKDDLDNSIAIPMIEEYELDSDNIDADFSIIAKLTDGKEVSINAFGYIKE